MSRSVVIAAACALALGGCDLFEAPSRPDAAPSGEGSNRVAPRGDFAHSQTEDLSGFYMPDGPVGEGDERVVLVFIGQAPDFEDWEKGQRDGFAPVMLELAGGERILPDSYSVSDDRVRFTGTSPTLGRVTLDARMDAGALALARRNLGPDRDPAMEGAVVVGGRTHSGVKFAWSLGGG